MSKKILASLTFTRLPPVCLLLVRCPGGMKDFASAGSCKQVGAIFGLCTDLWTLKTSVLIFMAAGRGGYKVMRYEGVVQEPRDMGRLYGAALGARVRPLHCADPCMQAVNSNDQIVTLVQETQGSDDRIQIFNLLE